MPLAQILTIVGLCLLYGSALLTGYINIRIKLKELDVKIVRLETDVKENKMTNEKGIDELNKKNSEEHGTIMEKIDYIKDTITDIKVIQAKIEHK